MPLVKRAHAHPTRENEAAIEQFLARHRKARRRLLLGESPEQGLVLNMKDKEGRTRIELRVRPDGTPVLQFLDAQGEVIQQLPEPGKNKG